MSIKKADVWKKIDEANEELLKLYPGYNNGFSSNKAFTLVDENQSVYRIDFFYPNGDGYYSVTRGKKSQYYKMFDPYKAAHEMYERFCKNRNVYGVGIYRKDNVRFV